MAAGALVASMVAYVWGGAPARRGGEALGAVQAATGADDRSVVLITLDGVRWQEIFRGVDPALAAKAGLPRAALEGPEGLVPAMHRLFFGGGVALGDLLEGGGIAASGPRYLSMPGYVELLTGAASECVDNACAPRLERTLADDIGRLPSVRAREEVAVFASWEDLGRAAAAAATSAAASTAAPEAAPHGVHIDAGRQPDDPTPPHPGHGRYRPDRATALAAIAHLTAWRPRFLWVALGDTDEWAHRNDYRGYLDALRSADRFVGEVAQHLTEMGRYGERVVLLVTTDHGRDKGFADHGDANSAAVWLLARGGGIPARGVIGTRRQRWLRDVAPTARALLGLPELRCAGCGRAIEELLPPG